MCIISLITPCHSLADISLLFDMLSTHIILMILRQKELLLFCVEAFPPDVTGRYELLSLTFVLWVPYIPAHETHQPIRCTMNFSLGILEKNNDECFLILVIYWKKTGLLHNKISNHNIIYSS